MVYVPFLAGRELTADLLNTRLVEVIMDWTPIDDIGNYAAGFSAGGDTPRMRKISVLGVERWEFAGRVNVVATTITANVNTTMFTFDVGYRPTTERGWPLIGSNTLFYNFRTTISSAGLWQVGLPTAAGNNATGVYLEGIYMENPLGL